jgi:PhnB protein
MSKVPFTPAGYHSVTPYLCVKGAAQAIDFYQRAFNAEQVMRLDMGPDTIAHAEVKIGGCHIMLSDEFPGEGAVSPSTLGGSTSFLMVYVPDVDAAYKHALAAGAQGVKPPEDQFYGDRTCQVKDPFGHRWALATHIEDVSPQEIERRMAAMSG